MVVGYGSVGRGVADTAHAYGGTVCVVERDPARALEAKYAGWDVRPLETAIPEADVIVTATERAVVNAAHLPLLKDGAFLLNVGHRPDEIDVTALRSSSLHRSSALREGHRPGWSDGVPVCRRLHG